MNPSRLGRSMMVIGICALLVASLGRVAAQTPPARTVPMEATQRPVERMVIYASGSNNCTVYINNKEVLPLVTRENASKVRAGLREGDVIAVRNGDRFNINSFWLSCIASSGEFLFATSPEWNCYVPGDYKRWWDIRKLKEQKPVQFAPDSLEYVDQVKRSAATTPQYRGIQPIHCVLEGGERPNYGAYMYYVVTAKDRLPKK